MFLSVHAWLRWLAARLPGREQSRFAGTAAYWDKRYSKGGTSGLGSHGQLATFKADFLNDFVRRNQVSSVIEFGCGDGSQLQLARYPRYLGLDVSRHAIRACIDKFREDSTKSFCVYDSCAFGDSAGWLSADLAISLDVIYHLVENDVFQSYLQHLFLSAKRFVVIYSCDSDDPSSGNLCTHVRYPPHVRPRRFTEYVEQHFPEWHLTRRVANRFPWHPQNRPDGSWSDFFVFCRQTAD